MTFLKTIVEKKREDIAFLEQSIGLARLKHQAEACVKTGFVFEKALLNQGLSLIAEVKKASPSKGVIRSDFEPVQIAKEFERQGASAVSVLTEKHFFLGDPTYLTEIVEQVNLPVLRKDFILDPIQVYETVVMGADAFLLIAALLSKEDLQRLYKLGRSLGLSVLIELHDLSDCAKLEGMMDVPLLGINNRNLKTFDTCLKTVPKLKEFLCSSGYEGGIVAESGYHSRQNLEELDVLGVDAVLIGEGLATFPDLILFFENSDEN